MRFTAVAFPARVPASTPVSRTARFPAPRPYPAPPLAARPASPTLPFPDRFQVPPPVVRPVVRSAGCFHSRPCPIHAGPDSRVSPDYMALPRLSIHPSPSSRLTPPFLTPSPVPPPLPIAIPLPFSRRFDPVLRSPVSRAPPFPGTGRQDSTLLPFLGIAT